MLQYLAQLAQFQTEISYTKTSKDNIQAKYLKICRSEIELTTVKIN